MGGVAGVSDSGVRPPMGTDGLVLACAAIPPAPSSNVFRNRGTPPVPRRGLRPLHPAWRAEGERMLTLLQWRGERFLGCPLHSGVGMGGLPRVRGQGQEWGLMVANAIIPPSPASNVFWYRGTRCTPGGGAAPCTLLGGGRFLTLEPGRAKHSPAPMRRFLHPQGGESGSHLSMAS